MQLTPHDQQLAELLRQLPHTYDCRYTDKASRALSKILFVHLANCDDGYLHYLFPNGPPNNDTDSWRLSEAQGAIDGAEYSEAARGRRCGHIFRNGEATYSCRTCTADDTCVLCTKCFGASDHEGHQVYVSMSPGANGCCDCGDLEAWIRPIHCSIHTKPPQVTSALGIQGRRLSPLPTELQTSIRVTISRVMDFLCDVLSCCPEEMRSSKSESAIRQDEERSRLTETPYGDQDPQDKEFALILWNDEKHTVKEVAEQVAKACKKQRTFGAAKAAEIDEIGRSVLGYSRNLQDLLHQARILGQIKVTVTIRSSRDTFREQMCDTIIEWLLDIAGCSVADDHNILMNVICEELLRPWRVGSAAINLEIASSGIVDHEKSDRRLTDMRRQLLEAQQAAQRATIFARLQGRRIVPPVNPIDANAGTGDARIDAGLGIVRTVAEADDDRNDDGTGQDNGLAVEVEDEMDLDEAIENIVDGARDAAAVDEQTIGLVQLLHPASTAHQSQGPDSEESDEEALDNIFPERDHGPFGAIPRTPRQKACQGADAPAYWTDRQNALFDRRSQSTSPPHEDLSRRIRMDHLIMYDLRMWKKMRNNLKHLYISTVVTIPEFKRILSLRFAALYTHLAQLYLIADREPDHSVINLSLQMLTTPSITAEVVRRGNFFTRLLAILYTFLTKRQVGTPEDVDPLAMITFETGVMTNRRIYHFFSDMKYLLDAPYVQDAIRNEHDYLLQFLDFAKLYQGICPNVRAVGEHIEYESDAWISASMIVRDVTRLSRQLSESFRWTKDQDPAGICRAIRQTAKVTIINSLGAEHERFTQAELKGETRFISLRGFRFGDQIAEYSIVHFDVEKAPMSFHHVLHYTLSWLIDCGKSMSPDQLQGLLSFTPQQLQPQDMRSTTKSKIPYLQPQQYLLALFDIPLRVCAWLAQMRAGMWVRNGITLRHQMGTFRGVGQREVSHQRDLFLLQVAFVVCDPATVLASIADRFGMSDWLRCDYKIKVGYEDHQLVDVAEDFVHLLIVLLSDRTLLFAAEEDPEPNLSIAKKDIIQVLCFKPLTYSELTARLSDKVQELDTLQQILEEVAHFRPPEGLSDSGLLQLKERYFQDIDPYHAYYSKSQREEAENVLRVYLAKQTGKAMDEIFYEPKLRPINSGLFSSLPGLTQIGLFGHTVYCLLRYVLHADMHTPNVSLGRVEGLLQTTLHLILIAVLEDQRDAPNLIMRPLESFIDSLLVSRITLDDVGKITTLEILFMLMKIDKYQANKPRIRFLLHHIQKKRPQAFALTMEKSGFAMEWQALMQKPGSANTDELKRRKKQALERQAKVLESFKRQQSEFIENQTIDSAMDDVCGSDEDADLMDQQPEHKTWTFPMGTCIFCQEENKEQQLYGTLAYMAQSNMFRQTDLSDTDYIKEVCTIPPDLDRPADNIRPFGVAGENIQRVDKVDASGNIMATERRGLGKGFPASHHEQGPVITGCGHVMHLSCFQTYDEATARRHSYQIARNHPEDTNLKEFVCPLCKALGNAFLPIIWKPRICLDFKAAETGSFDRWVSEKAPLLIAFTGEPADTIGDVHHQYTADTLTQCIASPLLSIGRGIPDITMRHPLGLTSRFRLPAIVRFEEYNAPSERHSNTASPSRPLILSELVKAYERLLITMKSNGLQSDLPGSSLSGELNSADVLARALGFSISAVEIAQRGIATPSVTFVEAIPEQIVTHLRVLSETVSSYIAITTLHNRARNPSQDIDYARSQAQRLLRQTVPAEQSAITNATPLFSSDSFVFLSECSVYLVPILQVDIRYVLRLCYIAEMVKVVVGLLYEPFASWQLAQTEISNALYYPTSSQCTFQQAWDVSAFIEHVLMECRQAGLLGGTDLPGIWIDANPNNRYAFDKFVHYKMTKYALPFLRKCTLLLHVRYGLNFSSTNTLGQSQSLTSDSAAPELVRLSQILGLPTVEVMAASFLRDTPEAASLRKLSSAWITHWSFAHRQYQHQLQRPALLLPHPAIYELIALPYAHDTLNAEAMLRRCPTTGRELYDPSICLFCGAFVCSQSQCCARPNPRTGGSIGGCYQHRERCGGNIGMFLNIRKCAVLLLHRSRGSFFTAPYLDKHGEVDMGLRRKNQLFLNQRRYDRLFRDVWLSHGIPTAVARKLEAEVNTGGWETI